MDKDIELKQIYVFAILFHFNCRDLPADILHHFILGWEKKTLQSLVDNHLSRKDLGAVCAVLDKIVWKVCM